MTPTPGDLVYLRLKGTTQLVLGIVPAADPEGQEGQELRQALRLLYPAVPFAQAFAIQGPIGQRAVSTMPCLFFWGRRMATFAWDEIAECEVMSEDDLGGRFEYGRAILAEYRANVARWDAAVAKVPTRVIAR